MLTLSTIDRAYRAAINGGNSPLQVIDLVWRLQSEMERDSRKLSGMADSRTASIVAFHDDKSAQDDEHLIAAQVAARGASHVKGTVDIDGKPFTVYGYDPTPQRDMPRGFAVRKMPNKPVRRKGNTSRGVETVTSKTAVPTVREKSALMRETLEAVMPVVTLIPLTANPDAENLVIKGATAIKDKGNTLSLVDSHGYARRFNRAKWRWFVTDEPDAADLRSIMLAWRFMAQRAVKCNDLHYAAECVKWHDICQSKAGIVKRDPSERKPNRRRAQDRMVLTRHNGRPVRRITFDSV